MRCEQVQSMLSAYADGELSPRHAARVSQHLAACEGCRAESATLVRVVAALRSLAEEELPTGLHGAILHALDTARPSLWQRLCAVTLVFQPARPLAFGTVAAALAILAVTSTPLHHEVLRGGSVARLPYHGAADAITAPSRTSPQPEAVHVSRLTPPEPPRELVAMSPASGAPTIVPTSSDAHAKQPEPTPQIAQAVKTAPTATRATANSRGAADKGSPRRTPPAPMSTFDPLAPVLEPTGSRMDPAMANVVVAEPTPTLPQTENSLTASAPGGSEVTTASASNDDLTSLRQRLSQEPIQLPTVKLKPRPRPSKNLPLIHSDF
jgi:hypothetical protein